MGKYFALIQPSLSYKMESMSFVTNYTKCYKYILFFTLTWNKPNSTKKKKKQPFISNVQSTSSSQFGIHFLQASIRFSSSSLSDHILAKIYPCKDFDFTIHSRTYYAKGNGNSFKVETLPSNTSKTKD